MPLQPLRIPGGWEIIINKLTGIQPADHPDPEDDVWLAEFVEDILYFRTRARVRKNRQTLEHTLGVDLGWYPDGDPNGEFCLMAVLDSDWEHPLKELRTRSQPEVVAALESWLMEYSYGNWVPR